MQQLLIRHHILISCHFIFLSPLSPCTHNWLLMQAGIESVFPALTCSSTWLLLRPWNGKLPKVIISYRRTPYDQTSDMGVKRPSERLSGAIHRTGSMPRKKTWLKKEKKTLGPCILMLSITSPSSHWQLCLLDKKLNHNKSTYHWFTCNTRDNLIEWKAFTFKR